MRAKLHAVPVSRDQWRLFVRTHHRHNGPLPAEVLKVGLADPAGLLVACGVAGLPPVGAPDEEKIRWRLDA